MFWFKCKHKNKVYLAIKDYGACYASPPIIQVARWQCDDCGHLGETSLYCYYYISFGKLIPDSKRWSNWGEKKP